MEVREMKKYEVGMIDNFIGVYSANSEEEAIKKCKQDLKDYCGTTHPREEWIANRI